MKKVVEIAHDLLKLEDNALAIDFTCGNGFDTYYLAQNFINVIALDIQEIAIRNTKIKCEEFNNITYYLSSYEQAHQYAKHFNAGIFNCGYLPHGEKMITTTAQGVIKTLTDVLPLLSSKGRIIIVLYPGFEEGKKEAHEIERHCMNFASASYDVSKIQLLNRRDAPYIIMIDKH